MPWQTFRLLMQSQMMFLVQHRKLSTAVHQLLEMGLHHPLILAGLVRPLVALISHPQEALPNQQHLASLRLGRLPQVPFQQAQELQASFLEPLLPQVDTLQDRVYLDSSPPTLELPDSSPRCQVSSHQVGHPCHTPFLDSSPPHLGLHRAHIQMCLSHLVHLGLACTAQEALVPFHQMEAQDMEEECFPQFHQVPGVHPEGASLLNLALQEASVQGLWDHTEDLQLQVECCHHIDHPIFEHNEQLIQSQEEDSTTAITKSPINIQSELRVLEPEHIAHTDILEYHLCKQIYIFNVAGLLHFWEFTSIKIIILSNVHCFNNVIA
ncbi:uncharacterized protein LOC109078072 isoform X3 [Cyprinus carpio]|uniref:Uncharacterized protein LOC109078072 isoform X3 n=1 Tax=Cyprinus carpio TaxID=7962 RepID=A0A9Q9YRU8_CYPCA|nr:uncharacterized protein LOC109078072 isoform X3 [Cyprinus carpio]